MDSVLNSFNKNTRAKNYGGKKNKDNEAFRVAYFWRIRENLKLNLVQVLVLVLQSEGL